MASTEKYLNQLIADKTALANNLTTKGVTASSEETFTELVPKVLDIQAGGGNEITKGLVINATDEDGYVIDASIVGMTEIPPHYLSYACYYSNSVNSFLSKIGPNLHLPNNITKIGTAAFQNCTGLTLTKLPDSLITIGTSAFTNCTNLALSELPSNLTTIEGSGFYNCTLLALSKLPNKITTIGERAFFKCTELSLTKLPDDLITLGNYAFQNCYKLALTELPSGLIGALGQSVFENCSKITITEIPIGVTSIGNYAFQYCSSLTKIDILGTLTSINTCGFKWISGLNTIILRQSTPPTLVIDAFSGTGATQGKGGIYVPDEALTAYQEATNWSYWASYIKGISELPTE